MKIPTLDLFSGIGGFSVGLNAVCRTVAYCESDAQCTRVLERNMQRKKLDKAEIFPDVTLLNEKALARLKPAMLTAGFPCQDISSAKRDAKGLDGDRSSLFFEIIRIIDECPTIKYALLENSPNITKLGIEVVEKMFVDRKWTVCWSIFSATEVGRPHRRKRWVALACAPGATFQKVKYERATQLREPARVVVARSSEIYRRCGLLGNSVVPGCMLFALATLSAVMQSKETLECADRTSIETVSRLSSSKVERGCRHAMHMRPLNLELFDGNVKFNKDYWITPIKSKGFWSKYLHLNERYSRFLPAQIVHERGTEAQIRKLVGSFNKSEVHVNPEFVEWLMGFGKGWTAE